MSVPDSEEVEQGWHFSAWGKFGYAETFLKGCGMIAAFAALSSLSKTPILHSGGVTAQLVFLGIASGTITLAIGDRLMEKDILSMVFVIFNIAAHWCLFAVVLDQNSGRAFGIIFYSLYMAGDVVKLAWLWVSDMSQDGSARLKAVPREALLAGTGFFILMYVCALISGVVADLDG